MHVFHYTIEPTGSNSPSQNGAAEIYNDKFGVRARALLYGAGLPARFWSAALLHLVHLHNRLVHSETKKTPFEGYYGAKPDLSSIKVFGSRVCVRQSGKRQAKLDHHKFTGIFLGYLATDQNIVYLDLNTGVIKTSHHATFDEAWYLQPTRPPAAQLLYDLGLEYDNDANSDLPPNHGVTLAPAPWPPMQFPHKDLGPLKVPTACLRLPLPLRETAIHCPHTAAAALLFSPPCAESPPCNNNDDANETLHPLDGPKLRSTHTTLPSQAIAAKRTLQNCL